MKKIKHIFVPIFMAVIVLIMALPSFAATENYTFKRLFTDDANSAVYVSDEGGTTYEVPYQYGTSGNSMMVYAKDFVASTVTILGNSMQNVGKWEYEANSVLYMKIPNFIYYFRPSGYDNLSDYHLKFIVTFVSQDLSVHEVVIFNDIAKTMTDELVRWSPIEFYYEIPPTYTRINTFCFEIDCPPSTGNIGVETSMGFEVYLGSAEAAPIYSAADVSAMDSLKNQEDQLRSQTQSGLDESLGFFDSVTSILNPASEIGEGALAVTAILNQFFNPFSYVLTLSLTIGMIMFILGIATWIGISVNRRSGDKYSKGGGK